jgi:hypothetical protein
MGYPTRIQLIHRQASQQWYVNFPSAIAQAMEFRKGEVFEWVFQDKRSLLLRRTGSVDPAHDPGKKKRAKS